jgi:hypothetical protein
MKPIYQFYFVLDNVVIQSLSRTIINSIKDRKTFSDSNVRRNLYIWEDKYFSGKLSKEEFINNIGKIPNLNMNAEEIKSDIIGKQKFIKGIIDILKELKEQYSLFLYSQYPPDDLLDVFSRLKAEDIFSESRILYSQKIGLSDNKSNLFNKLISDESITPGTSIWIDSNPRRTSASIRAGIDSIIFVDSKRLRREIALRGLLPLLGDE